MSSKIKASGFKQPKDYQTYMNEAAKLKEERHLINNNPAQHPKDTYLDEREFIMDVYKNVPDSPLNSKIIELCKEESWKNKNPAKVLGNFIQLVSPTSHLEGSEKAGEVFLKKLNKRSTSNHLKETFMQMLNIDAKDMSLKDIANFKFTDRHLAVVRDQVNFPLKLKAATTKIPILTKEAREKHKAKPGYQRGG